MTVTLSQTARDINKVKFVDKDFDTYVEEIADFIKTRYGDDVFNDYVASDLGVMLIELVAASLGTMSWYLDRQSSETYLDTALLRSSVAKLTRQIGFKMTGAIASTADVNISLNSTQASDVVIPAESDLSGPNSLIFQTVSGVTFLAGETGPKTVSVIEAQTIEEVFESDGSENQIFNLKLVEEDKFIIDRSVQVFVAGVEWAEVDFMEFEKTDIFEAEYNTSPARVRFGDGIAGNIPKASSEIRIKYKVCNGANGDVSSNTITALAIAPQVGLTTVETTVTNPSASAGGADSMSLPKAKTLAPKVFKTQGRAVTEEDYDSFINAFSDPSAGAVGIGKSFIIRSMDKDVNLTTQLNNLRNSVTVQGRFVEQLASGTGVQTIYSMTATNLPIAPGWLKLYSGDITVTDDGAGNLIGDVASGGTNTIDYGTGALSVTFSSAPANGAGIYADYLTTTIGTILTNIKTYWEEVLSSTCQANVVQALILAKDSQGVYIPPTLSLVQALDAELESKKEATVNIVVLSGENNLFSVNISANIKILDTSDSVVVIANVKTAIEAHLKSKNFGDAVRIGDLYSVVEGVTGVDYSHITITEPSTKVDSNGDLIFNNAEIATLGTVTVTAI